MSIQIILLKIALCCAFVFFLAQNPLIAQSKPKPMLKKDELPTLNKAVVGSSGDRTGKVIDTSKKKEEPALSEVDVLNRSEADGKMSRTERSLLERARRQPQVR